MWFRTEYILPVASSIPSKLSIYQKQVRRAYAPALI